MYYVIISRECLLDFLPPGAVVAEIGVAEGEFSQQILERTCPRRLHLIDAWRYLPQTEYLSDPNNVQSEQQEVRYKHVLTTFDREITRGQVVVHRALSQEAAEDFPPRYFDWIYIDAMHTYEATLRDLCLYRTKVRLDGFILGHDFCRHSMADRMHFGVIPAVQTFTCRFDFRLVVLTADVFSTYVLVRRGASAAGRQLSERIFESDVFAIEVSDGLLPNYAHRAFAKSDRSLRWIPSFDSARTCGEEV